MLAGSHKDHLDVWSLCSLRDCGGIDIHIWSACAPLPVWVCPLTTSCLTQQACTSFLGQNSQHPEVISLLLSNRGSPEAPGDDLRWSKWGFWLVSLPALPLHSKRLFTHVCFMCPVLPRMNHSFSFTSSHCLLQAHTVLFLLVYALILILPNTKWRDRLPAKPSFYRYILVLFALNVLAGLGELRALMSLC